MSKIDPFVAGFPLELAEIVSIHRGLTGGFVMEAADGGTGGSDGAPPSDRTFSQSELNAILAEDRRKTAGKFADYDDLKAKAAQYDQAEQANKSELQKALDRATAAEKERDDLKAANKDREDREAHASQIKTWAEAAAKKTGVPADAIKGNTEDEIKAHAATLAGLLPRKGHVPTEGTQPVGDGNSELRAFTQQLFGKTD